MTTTTFTTNHQDAGAGCAARGTKTLLAYGVVAGPLYVGLSLAQVFTRDGFDPTRHQWSMLTLGEHGWIQTTNFIVTGLMIIAAAIGLRRQLASGKAATWTPRLLTVFGLSLIAAGSFIPDPALGFPVGTPAGPGQVSWHGMVHFAAAGVGFTAFALACFVLARRYAQEGRRGFTIFSRVTGIVFLAGFACVASGAGSVAANLASTAAVALVFGWLTAVSLDRYRSAARGSH